MCAMTSTKSRIATELERSFARQGFAEQGVEALRAEADVSLRTLYKHFPSREAMIIGALEHRDRTYFDWLAGGAAEGVDHVLHPLVRLGDWLGEVANTGCLFLNALAEYPDSAAIAAVVKDHKARLADEFRLRLERVAPGRDTRDLAATLFETTQEVLEAAGFDAYEVSNHARGEAARSRHNLVYWRGVDYVGVGPGAHGRLALAEGRAATTAHRAIKDYVAAVREHGVGFEHELLNPEEAAEERLVLGLRIDDGVGFDEMAPLGLSPDLAKVRDLVEAGLLVDSRDRLRATRAGRLVLDRLTGALAT